MRMKKAQPSPGVAIKTVAYKNDKFFVRREPMEPIFIESIDENFSNNIS
jgi:hypothetical protein